MDKQRCSSLDRIIACPDSMIPTDNPYNPGSPEATAGTGKHVALAILALNGDVPESDRVTIARDHGLEAEDIDATIGAGRRVLREVDSWFEDCLDTLRVEVKLVGPVSKGSTDVLIVGRDKDDNLIRAVVIDWKGGWKDIEHPAQLKGYASGARAEFGMPSCGYVTTVEAWLRHGERVVHNYTAGDLDAFEKQVADAVAATGDSCTPGDHCVFCPRQLGCDERSAYFRSAGVALSVVTKGAVMTRADLGGLWDKYKALQSAMARFERIVSAELRDGPIPLPDGRQLELVEKQLTQFDALTTLPILEAHGFDAEDLRECLTVSKGKIEAAAKRHAPPRKGAALMREITAEVREAGGTFKKTELHKTIVEAPALEPNGEQAALHVERAEYVKDGAS